MVLASLDSNDDSDNIEPVISEEIQVREGGRREGGGGGGVREGGGGEGFQLLYNVASRIDVRIYT